MACIAVRVRGVALAERAAAEAYAAGAVGLEERDEGGRLTLLLYAPRGDAPLVRAAVASALPEVEVDAVRDVEPGDWSEAWKRELRALEISPRLVVRPSFVDHALRAGQREVVIDPGQAFGTGIHPSTRLALEWIDALVPGLKPGARALDVGTGTGLLALAALRLGCADAVGTDVDPLAVEAARANALINGLGDRLAIAAGELPDGPRAAFDFVVANLLRTEMLPMLPAIAECAAPDAPVVLSGLLASEREEVTVAGARAGLSFEGSRERDDPDGFCWTALLMRRASVRASS